MPVTTPPPSIPSRPLKELAEAYLQALLHERRREASCMVLDAARAGVSIKDIYIDVFQATQHEIGRLWEADRITVAQEHYCTAVTQLVMSQLYPQIFTGPRNGRCFVGACVAGDLHEIGVRMVADFFEMEGWDSVYLGANVPIPDLIKTLEHRTPDVLGVSATLTTHVDAAIEMIAAVRASSVGRNLRIIVGGAPFLAAPDLWTTTGADGTATSARSVVEAATRLLHRKDHS